MKKLIFLFVLISFSVNGQITLEQTYPGTSIIANGYNTQNLYMVKLEVDGEKYVHIDRTNRVVKFYNLNHTFYKSISFSAAADVNSFGNISQEILYISQKLFDNDNEIEFLYVDQDGPSAYVTQIINEDGTVIFTANNEYPAVRGTAPQAQLPIYNTSAGTKLILSAMNGDGKVYSLPGTLSAITVRDIENPHNENSKLFPNPTSNKISITNTKVAIKKVNIIDINGKLIDSILFDNSSNDEIDVSHLSSGEYIIQILDKNENIIDNQKIIRN